MKIRSTILSLYMLITLASCSGDGKENRDTPDTDTPINSTSQFTGAEGEVKIMTLDPGHFHAALVQKKMYKQINPEVYIFAPEGAEVHGHLKLIDSFNSRDDNPTSWSSKLYTGEDFFDKMISSKPGNVMVVAGNNAKKTDYILKAIKAGINVLADKPMVISPEKFPLLEEAFKEADSEGVLLYDIMTERYEVNTILQKELSLNSDLFGTLQRGTVDNPAITKESVHHFFKYVSGSPLKRPAWFFDVTQEGEGIVDVTTHLVDLIQWEAYPEVILSKKDVDITSAKRWATELTPEMFNKVTGQDRYPDYLKSSVDGTTLKVFCNGEINYKLKDTHAKVSVIWNFQAPEGSADTHYSIMRGTKSSLIIKQGPEENFKPTLYIELTDGDSDEFEKTLETAIRGKINTLYPGVTTEKIESKKWRVDIPSKYKLGHEAHFGQVTEKYLQYLKDGALPKWEVPNMIVKYYTTTEGLKEAIK